MKNPGSLSAQKAAVRQLLRVRRNDLSVAQCTSQSAGIQSRLLQLPELNTAKAIFCFISTPREVSTGELIDKFLALGKTVLVPKILPGEPMRAVAFTGWNNLAPGVLGIPAPIESAAYTGRVDLVITPGLGFTLTGTRIGYGRGYYDRWFTGHEHGLRVGVTFECQLEQSLPTEVSDIPMHILITEQKIIRI